VLPSDAVFAELTVETHQAQERLPMKMSEVVEHVSKKPVPPHARNILVEVMCNDTEGEDVEVGTRDEGKRSLILMNLFSAKGPLLFDSHLKDGKTTETRQRIGLQCISMK
jgi:hypothetical protein